MEKLFSWANVHKSWFTTLVGVIVIIASVVSVFSHGRSWEEAAAGITIGLVLMGLRDPKVNGGANDGAMGVVCGLVLLSMLTFGGCVSEKKVLAKLGTQNAPVTVAVTDTLKLPITVTTKADSLSTSFSLDSLADANCGDTLQLVSAGGLATMKVWKSPVDKVGGSQRLHALVKVPPQVIHDTITKVVTVYAKCPPTYTITPTVKLTRWQRYWGHFQDFSSALVLLAIIIGLILAGFKYRPWRFLPFLGVVLVLGGAGGCHTAKPVPQPKDRPAPMPDWIKRDLRRHI